MAFNVLLSHYKTPSLCVFTGVLLLAALTTSRWDLPTSRRINSWNGSLTANVGKH